MVNILRIAFIIAVSALLVFVILSWPLAKEFVQEWLNNIAIGK